jgi:hypothetical protein
MDDNCQLLSLPPELRNRIYEMVLVQSQTVMVAPAGISEPALLSTAKQVRNEAIQIYYGQNIFHITIDNLNPYPLVRWKERRKALKRNCRLKMKWGWSCPVQPARQNLHRWLEAYHDSQHRYRLRRVSEIPMSAPLCISEEVIIGGMFYVVQCLRGRPWDEVERVLEESYHMLEARDKGWQLTSV